MNPAINDVLASLAPVAVAPSRAVQGVSLQRNFAWTLAGNVAYAACQWGILVALAKLGTPAMVGEFALGLAVSAPVFMLTSLQLRAMLATDARHEYRFGHYLALRLLGTAAGVAGIAAFVAVAGFRRETAAVVLLVSVAKAFDSLSDIIYGLWQKHERFDKMAIALSGRGICSLAAMAAVLALTRNLIFAAAAMAAVWAVWLATYERRGAKAILESASSGERLRAEWDTTKCRRLALLSLPLGVVMLLGSLNANLPRYFIQHDMNEAALGYFAALAYVLVAGNTFMGAIGQSAVPRLARSFHADRPAFGRILRNMVLLGVALGVAGILLAVFFGAPILRLLYRTDYADYADVFRWLMVASALAYVTSMLGYAMTAARLFRPQVPLVVAATVVTAVACWIFIPSYGLTGGAWAVLAGAIVSCGGSAIVMYAGLRSRPQSAEC